MSDLGCFISGSIYLFMGDRVSMVELIILSVLVLLITTAFGIIDVFHKLEVSGVEFKRSNIMFTQGFLWKQVSEIKYSRFLNTVTIKSDDGQRLKINSLYKNHIDLYQTLLSRLVEVNKVSIPIELTNFLNKMQ